MLLFPVFLAPLPATAEPVSDRLIVKWRESPVEADPAAVQRLAVRSALPALRPHRNLRHGIQVLQLPRAVDLETARAYAARLAADPAVAYAQPDRRFFPFALPSDPLYYDFQWNLHPAEREPGSASVENAWADTTGDPGVTIAVVDTGILPHADLIGRYYTRIHPRTKAEIPYGYDFVDADGSSSDGTPVYGTANDGDGPDIDPTDEGDWVTAEETAAWPFNGCIESRSSWHGTHLAGLIGASANGAGIVGIDWQAKILPVRVLGKCGGYLSDILAGVLWAAGVPLCESPAGCDEPPRNAYPAKIINLSLGAAGPCGPAEQEIIDMVTAAGATVVVAAGNGGGDASQVTPAGCDGVIAVAALTRTGQMAPYSNRGAIVDIAAPGGYSPLSPEGILSTLDSGETVPKLDNAYGYYAGTSMSAPHVSGTLSLMLAASRELTGNWLPRETLEAKLLDSARPFPVTGADGDCTPALCGSGADDAAAAVAAVSTPPVVDVRDRLAAPGDIVALEAEVTDDGRIVSYAWEQIDNGSPAVDLSGTGEQTVHFTAPAGPEGTLLRFMVTVVDDVGLSASAESTITVSRLLPRLGAVDDQSVRVGELLEVPVTASQPDGGVPRISLAAAPPGTELADHGDGSGTVTWRPQVAGNYEFTVRAENSTDPAFVSETSFGVTVTTAAASTSGGGGGGGGGAGFLAMVAGIYGCLRRRRSDKP